MDKTLLLFMHALTGLKIEPDELTRITEGDPRCEKDLADRLRNPEAREYLRRHPDWPGESLRVLEQSHLHGVRWSRVGDEDYPPSWMHLSQRPPVFSFKGEPVWKTAPLIAVVGSRTPMPDSKLWMQRELSRFLRHHGAGVVSGGARGVDQWAHRLSMDEGRPTVCVLPSGILNPYPPEHFEFWQRIVEGGGCLISTFGLREPMKRLNFEVRNRWIVGLSPCLLVIEANRRSGSSMTAKLAKQEGREIGTLPVSPYCEQGLNNLDLIFDGSQMLRDHLDLSAFWNRNLSPTLFQRMQGESEEEGVDGPQA